MPISTHHTTWKNAKKTYKAQLDGIKFNSDFGPDLDKLEKKQNTMPKNTGQMMSHDTEVKELAKKCSATANLYLQKINAVEDNGAKTALRNALLGIKTECDNLAK